MTNAMIEQAIALALQHHQAGRLPEAESIYRQILAAAPNHSDALQLLGVIAHQSGRSDVAITLIQKAIQQKPTVPEYYTNLGEPLRATGQIDQAIAAYNTAIQLRPDLPDPHYNLGNIFSAQGQLDRAVASYRTAILLNPHFTFAYMNLGVALTRLGQLDEAVAAFRTAIQLDPNNSALHHNLAAALKDQAQLDEAITAFRTAIQLDPNNAEAHSGLIFITLYHPAYTSADTFAEAARFNKQFAEPLASQITPHTNDRSPNRHLKIGYVSPDFHNHCQSLFTIPLLRSHDHDRFEIHCFADVTHPSALTHELQGYADKWHNILGQSDQDVARLIRDQQIDILIDLTMHMGHNRLPVFARKPAPVQICWLAYPGTTGLTAIDHRLTDPYLDPLGTDESVYSEKPIRLPDSFWCYDPLDARDIPVNSLPAQDNGFITFGCLNNFCKINDGALTLWAQVMQQVPSSRLLLLAGEGSHRQRAIDFLHTHGIDSHRVEFSRHLPKDKYFALYHRIDIGLDSIPCNGHTTSLDSYWMGVPVVTLVGNKPVDRAGWSQLNNLNLTELAARTPEQYVQIAAQLANDLPRLADLRATLRQRMESSPLMNAPRFARNIEATYRKLWQKWCEHR